MSVTKTFVFPSLPFSHPSRPSHASGIPSITHSSCRLPFLGLAAYDLVPFETRNRNGQSRIRRTLAEKKHKTFLTREVCRASSCFYGLSLIIASFIPSSPPLLPLLSYHYFSSSDCASPHVSATILSYSLLTSPSSPSLPLLSSAVLPHLPISFLLLHERTAPPFSCCLWGTDDR